MRLFKCNACPGLLPPNASLCPHCGASVPRGRLSRATAAIVALASGASLSATLMACYGVAPCEGARCGAGGTGGTGGTPTTSSVGGGGAGGSGGQSTGGLGGSGIGGSGLGGSGGATSGGGTAGSSANGGSPGS
jgi:hypothetical protein